MQRRGRYLVARSVISLANAAGASETYAVTDVHGAGATAVPHIDVPRDDRQ